MCGTKIPSFYDLFPMYDTRIDKSEEDRKQTEIVKAQLLEFARMHNKRNKGG